MTMWLKGRVTFRVRAFAVSHRPHKFGKSATDIAVKCWTLNVSQTASYEITLSIYPYVCLSSRH